MAIWDDVISDRDRLVYQESGYGQRAGLGNRPALLVIDVTYAFTGDKPEPILNSIARWPNSCGEAAWNAISHIRRLLDAAHEANIPVIYTHGGMRPDGIDAGRWKEKFGRVLEKHRGTLVDGDAIVHEITPLSGDFVLVKQKPSAFFGTPLMSYLNDLDVDSLMVTGCTTSGCVRATVIDAFSYNFRVAVVEECTFDRGEVTHKVNLFDMNAKYADVIRIEDGLKYLGKRREKGSSLGSP